MEIAQTILAQKLAHKCVRISHQLVVPAVAASIAKITNGKYTNHPRATWDRTKMTERTVMEHMGCHKWIPYVLNCPREFLRARARNSRLELRGSWDLTRPRVKRSVSSTGRVGPIQ